MTIARTLSLALGVGTLLLPAAVGGAQNSLPAMHPEPITIRILDGKGGAPLAHVHLQVAAGYDDRDLRLGLWSEEVVTDGQGRASLPGSLKNFSLVAVWVAKHKLCGAHGRSTYMNLDNIRYGGLSTPNRCGTGVVAETPGVLNVFAKAHRKDLPLKQCGNGAVVPRNDGEIDATRCPRNPPRDGFGLAKSAISGKL